MSSIKHRFVALDYMHGRLHHVNENDPAANWSVPSGGMLQDLRLAGAGRLIVSLDDGWSFRRLADGGEVGRVKTGVTGIATLCLLPEGGVLAGVNTPAGIELVEFDEHGKAVPYLCAFMRLKICGSCAGAPPVPGCSPITTVRWRWNWREHRPGSCGRSRCPAPSMPTNWCARRTGHYLFSGGYAKGNFELAADGRCLHAFAVTQPSGLESYYYSGFQLLANGHVVQANWNGHNDSDYRHGLKLFEFDEKGNTVWSWIAPKEQVGSITAFIILDGLDPALPHDDATGVMEPMLTRSRGEE